jgi:replicative DNA helicase
MTGCLRGGDLVILAARPSIGKTAVALDISRHIALNECDPRTAAIFNLPGDVTVIRVRTTIRFSPRRMRRPS